MKKCGIFIKYVEEVAMKDLTNEERETVEVTISRSRNRKSNRDDNNVKAREIEK